MNMPLPSNMRSNYLYRSAQHVPTDSQPFPSNHIYQTFGRTQQNFPSNHINRSYSPNFPPQNGQNKSFSPMNWAQINNPQNVTRIPSNLSPQIVGGHYQNHRNEQPIYQQALRPNSFIHQPQIYPRYGHTNNPPVYSQLSYSPYQPYDHYQTHLQQPYTPQYNVRQLPMNYGPIYLSNQGFQAYSQPRKNIPEHSINSNFNYENANFDCNYSVEENLVHCVLCNQTYKTSQKKQHLELHRQKVRNVNIRPVDEAQLKRLEKYNAMNKKGLMLKPIVEPDEFNVQYNPNQFVLRKVTEYRDVDGPLTNEIQIQTQEPHRQSFNHLQDLRYEERRRSQSSSPQKNTNNRISQNVPVRQTTTFNRNTNTRFNNESIRQQEAIFLSDKFNQHNEGQSFNSSYNPDQSFRESERRSQKSQNLGYGGARSSNKGGNTEFINQGGLGYEQEKQLHSIRQSNEEYRNSNKKDISINEILGQVLKEPRD